MTILQLKEVFSNVIVVSVGEMLTKWLPQTSERILEQLIVYAVNIRQSCAYCKVRKYYYDYIYDD